MRRACFIQIRLVLVIMSVNLQPGLYCPWRTRGSRFVITDDADYYSIQRMLTDDADYHYKV